MKVSHTEEEGTDGVVARCFSINQQPGGAEGAVVGRVFVASMNFYRFYPRDAWKIRLITALHWGR